MRKSISTFLILVIFLEQTMLFAADSPKPRPTINEKISQPIYIPKTSGTGGSSVPLESSSKKLNINKPLWFESDSKETSEYAELVAGKAPAKLGDNAIILFGNLGVDDFKVDFGTAEKPQNVDMVASAIEYYFTNKVFIEGKYKEALIDLLQYMAEVPKKVDIVNSAAIPNTLWVAEQNGVKISMDEVKREFAVQIGAQIDQYAQEVKDYYRGSIKNIDLYLKEFTDALKAYYADPTQARMDALVDKGVEIDKRSLAEAPNKTAPIYLGWLVLNMSVVAKLSTSLAAKLSDRKQERTAQASAMSPVEVRTKDASAVAVTAAGK